MDDPSNMASLERHGPLTKTEKLAAFMAMVYAIDNAGFSPGYARITREDDRGVDYTFSVPNYAVRDTIAQCPKALADAESILRDSEGIAQ